MTPPRGSSPCPPTSTWSVSLSHTPVHMHPHFGFGGTPPLLYPCLGTAGTYWVPQSGKLGVVWSLSPCGTPVLSLLVANPKCPSAFEGPEEKGGPVPAPQPWRPFHCASPLPPIPAPHLCYGPTELPSSHGIPQRTPKGCLGTCLHLWASRGVLGGSGTSWHAGKEGLWGFWHLQACRGEASRLPAPPACWSGYWGLTAPSGMWEELRGSWHLQMCCGVCFGGFWDLHSCWGGSYGLSASSGLFGGGFGVSLHLHLC